MSGLSESFDGILESVTNRETGETVKDMTAKESQDSNVKEISADNNTADTGTKGKPGLEAKSTIEIYDNIVQLLEEYEAKQKEQNVTDTVDKSKQNFNESGTSFNDSYCVTTLDS